MKTRFYLLLAVLPMILGFAACTDKTDDPTSPAAETEVTDEVENITDDQLAVMVTADLPTAVLRPFDEGTTGAALVKRLSTVTSEFCPDTRMALVPGTMFDGATDMTDDELDALVQLELDGGYLAIERPTAQLRFPLSQQGKRTGRALCKVFPAAARCTACVSRSSCSLLLLLRPSGAEVHHQHDHDHQQEDQGGQRPQCRLDLGL